MKTGQTKRIWTKEQKLSIIKRYYEEHILAGSLAKELKADKGMICRWIRSYNQYGESAFNSKSSRKDNPFSALHTSKSLTEIDRLRLQLAKVEIGNERLKRLPRERSWCKQGVRYLKRGEYKIIYRVKDKYGVKFLCETMSVNRSGYYKWLERNDKPNRYEQDRMRLTELLLEQHKKHKTNGYKYLARLVRNETGWLFSAISLTNKLAGIRSKTTRPLEIVASDMTCIYHKGIHWEWTYISDIYNNEIILSSVTNKRDSSLPYYHYLNKNKRAELPGHFAHRPR